MAKDKVKLYCENIILKDDINLIGWKYIKQYNYWQCIAGPYYLKFLPINGSANKGYLIIHFSVSNVLNNNNAIPSVEVNSFKLAKKIYSDLKGILNLDVNDFRKLKVSSDETFIDAIGTKEHIKSFMHIIQYSQIPRRKVDTTHNKKGSLYMHSGNKREKASWALIAYDKGKERASKNIDITSAKNLKEGQVCLRLEVKTKGYSLKKLAKHFKHKPLFKKSLNDIKLNEIQLDFSNNFYHYIECPELPRNTLDSIQVTTNKNFVDLKISYTMASKYYSEFIDQLNTLNDLGSKFNLADILNVDFQAKLIKSFLKDLNLLDSNIKILTEENLFKFIDESTVIDTPTQKNNAKIAVRMLNGKKVKEKNKLKPKTLNKYKKQLLDLGVHYICVEKPMPKITQDMLNTAIYETGNLILE